MKVRIQGAGAMGEIRCQIDNRLLLVFHGDDVNLEDCEHYRWHLEENDADVTDIMNKEKEEKEDEEDNDDEEDEVDEEEEWKEVLKRNYIAAVSVEGGKFYLIHLEKAKPT
jgi:hypothetical protein